MDSLLIIRGIRYFGSRIALCLFFLLGCLFYGHTQQLQKVYKVELQPFVAATQRLITAMNYIGSPLGPEDDNRIRDVMNRQDAAEVVGGIQEILDKYTLIGVNINPESRVKIQDGPAKKQLIQNGWTSFLVKVENEAGITAPLSVESSNALPLYHQSGYPGLHHPPTTVPESEVPQRFLEIAMYNGQPLKEGLSGLPVEYKIVQLYSRDAGKKEIHFDCNVGQGTQDIGFRSETSQLFDIIKPVEVEVEILDVDGIRVSGSLLIKDPFGRIYPAPSRRLAPDFFFQEHIYRNSGETVALPPGKYTVEYSKGPEYLIKQQELVVPKQAKTKVSFQLERWINLAEKGWFSGDVHIHAAGCAHYESPTEGVLPSDMQRQIVGEDLKVGSLLTWGPSWYYQKQFFNGTANPDFSKDYALRYDVEVSGFPSSHAGHLSLLNLKEDDYQGVQTIEEWPSWDLPILQWAKAQGAVTGFTHTGYGLKVQGDHLPNYNMPLFDGIGANEYVVDVTHELVDVYGSLNTPPIWELNMWYHSLNCGFRARITGETDFPCIFDQKVGLGRSYVKMNGDPLTYENWIRGIKEGRNYVSDGRSHLFDFKIDDVRLGEKRGKEGIVSELDVPKGKVVRVSAQVAARLQEKPESGEKYGDYDTNSRSIIRRNPNLEYRNLPLDEKPYWHLEKARIGDSRIVPVELIVNGQAIAKKEIQADGKIQEVTFDVQIDHSSWVALRILPSSHTNPIFVLVDGKPIRASKRSAEWCLEAVDVCWASKSPNIREEEKQEARKAYDHAKTVYRQILKESVAD